MIFSGAEINSIRAILQELKHFNEVTGLRINMDKTKCLAIGNSADVSLIERLGLKQVNNPKVLGFIYNSSNTNIVKQNIAEFLPYVNKEITQWKRRCLTLVGRITVIKSMLSHTDICLCHWITCWSYFITDRQLTWNLIHIWWLSIW